uniref:CX domain-containing protein n=1 Tax=Caenorhabditis tropicalis TaxID=1561998 RepID=A0A1I7UIG4_9PELO
MEVQRPGEQAQYNRVRRPGRMAQWPENRAQCLEHCLFPTECCSYMEPVHTFSDPDSSSATRMVCSAARKLGSVPRTLLNSDGHGTSTYGESFGYPTHF